MPAWLPRPQRSFQLLSEVLGLGAGGGEGAHEAAELFLRDTAGKLDATEIGGGKQFREALLDRAIAERSAVEQKFGFRDSQHKGSIARIGQGGAKVVPGGGGLGGHAFVLEPVQSYGFQ